MNNESKNTNCATPKHAKTIITDWLLKNMDKLIFLLGLLIITRRKIKTGLR